MSELCVGIDLGTTNSLIGAVRNGRVELFADERGEQLLPSAVGMDDARVVIGRAARNRRLLDPERTVTSVKRSMGQDVRLKVGDRRLTPPQISALLLGRLLDHAEAHAGARPNRAVITVPAYFGEAQRQATRDAGELAGLRVEQLVNEPTAAALGYKSGGEELVLVYDLGGGTFDVSILEREEDVLEVSASHGDTQLGGDDIDQALFAWALEQLGGRSDIVSADPRARSRLLEAVERAKIALSVRSAAEPGRDDHEVRIFEPALARRGEESVNVDLPLSHATLAEIAAPFVRRTLAAIDRALADAKVSARDLDRVLLVGGSSQLAAVRELVQTHLDMPAHAELDADRAVAQGAALLAGRAMGADVADVLVDITPHTLAAGVVDLDSYSEELIASPLISRGTVVPAERTRTYMTRFEDQGAVLVPIAQGEQAYIEDNTHLGEVTIERLPPSPAGSAVEVTFRLDLSGVLHVGALHVPSGERSAVRIANSPYRLTDRARKQAERELAEVVELAQRRPAETASESELVLAKAMVARSDRALERAAPDTAASLLKQVESARAELVDAVERRAAKTGELCDALSDALLDLL